MAIEAADGLVIGSDLQRSGAFRELAPKIKEAVSIMRPCELLGCAGESRYIGVFRRHVKKAFESQEERIDYAIALDQAIDSYSAYLKEKIETQGLNKLYSYADMKEFWPQGILGVYDKSQSQYRIFEFQAPSPCLEVELFPRAAVGSGGDAALVLMKTIEELMDELGITGGWKRFPARVVRQFEDILLYRISRLDYFSYGTDIRVIEKEASYGIAPSEPIFTNPNKTRQVGEFIQSSLFELSLAQVKYMLQKLGLLDFVMGLK